MLFVSECLQTGNFKKQQSIFGESSPQTGKLILGIKLAPKQTAVLHFTEQMMRFQYADSFSKFSLLLQSRLKASVLQSIPLMTLSFEATIPNCWTSHISVVFRLLPTSARLLLSCVSLNFLTTLLTPVHDTRCDTNFEYSSPAL